MEIWGTGSAGLVERFGHKSGEHRLNTEWDSVA